MAVLDKLLEAQCILAWALKLLPGLLLEGSHYSTFLSFKPQEPYRVCTVRLGGKSPQLLVGGWG